MPERKRIVRLLALWREVCPLTDAKENRYERLRFLAQTVGRVIDSANDLTAEEVEKCIKELQKSQASVSSIQNKKVKQFPNHAGITERQKWKIWQLEHFLGWAENPARLDGLLQAKFRAPLTYLSHAQAWRAIEMLFSIAAREEARKSGNQYSEVNIPNGKRKISPEELKAVRARLKRLLETWRPESAA